MNKRLDNYRLVERGDALVVEWDSGEFRLDHVPGTEPRWIGAAADLEDETDRRSESDVVELLIRFGNNRNESVALFHDDGRIEYLVGD